MNEYQLGCIITLALVALAALLVLSMRSSQTSQFTITDAGRAALREEAEQSDRGAEE